MTKKELYEELLAIRELVLEATSTEELAILENEYAKLQNTVDYEYYNLYVKINMLTCSLDRIFPEFYELLS